MVCNLTTSYSGRFVDVYEDAESDFWLHEYFYGLTHEVYEILLPEFATGYGDV